MPLLYPISKAFLSAVQENTRILLDGKECCKNRNQSGCQFIGNKERAVTRTASLVVRCKEETADMIDRLDVTDKHYARKYQHISFRM